MRCLLTIILTLVALLGRDSQAAPVPPHKGVKKSAAMIEWEAALQQLSSPDAATRSKALKTLDRYYSGMRGAASRVATTLLNDASEEVRLEAVTVLESIGYLPRHAVLALAKALKDKSRKVRIRAAEALSQIGPCGKLAVPALVEALKDKDTFFRRKVVTALSNIGPPKYPDEAVRALVKALKDKDDPKDQTKARVRDIAAIALGNYGPAAASAVPALIEWSRSPDREMCRWALVNLGKIRAQPEVVVPLLLRFLNDKDQAAMRLAAVNGLGSMGPLAKEATPSLFKAFPSKDIKDSREKEWMQCCILRALVNVRGDVPRVVTLLIEIFQDKKQTYSTTLRQEAATLLGQMGPAAAKAVPVLIEALNHPRQYRGINMERIASALAAIGEPAVGPLIKNLSATKGWPRTYTIRALVRMGPKAAPALPALRELARRDQLEGPKILYMIRQIEDP